MLPIHKVGTFPKSREASSGVGMIELLTVLIECLAVLLEYIDLLSQSQGTPNFKEGSLYELDGHVPVQARPCLRYC